HYASHHRWRCFTGTDVQKLFFQMLKRIGHSLPCSINNKIYFVFHNVKNSKKYKIVAILSNYKFTFVPIFSPQTTFRRFPLVFISKTIIGSSFSWLKVKAVVSITFSPFCNTSSKLIKSNFVASLSFSGSLV